MNTQRFVASLVILTMAAPAVPAPRAQDHEFSKRLGKKEQILHALNRLTFCPWSGDIEQVQRMSLNKWIDKQLRPDSIVESPELERRLEPLESIRLPNRELTLKYPSPQLVVAYATGRLAMPDDPEARARIERLSVRYQQR